MSQSLMNSAVFLRSVGFLSLGFRNQRRKMEEDVFLGPHCELRLGPYLISSLCLRLELGPREPVEPLDEELPVVEQLLDI